MKKHAMLLTLLLTGCPPAPSPDQLPSFNSPVDAPAETLLQNTEIAALGSGIAVAIVLDASGSMSGERLETVKRVWRETLSPKLLAYHQLNGNLQVSLVRCSDSANVLVPMQLLDLNALNSSVKSLTASGGTPLGDSLRISLEQLALSPAEKRHIFILSDGENTGWVSPKEVLEKMQGRGLEKISIHVVGFETSRSNYIDFETFQSQVVMADDAATLDATCSTIFFDILKLEKE